MFPVLVCGADRAAVSHVGVLVPLAVSSPIEDGLLEGLREVGLIEGKSIQLDWQRSKRTDEELPALADRLVQAKVAVIVAIGTPASRAAMHASTSIPVVFVSGDPIAAGLAASLARPGANGTGVYVPSPELNAKRLELLTQIAPRAHRIAYLRNPSTVIAAEILKAVQNAIQTLNLELVVLDVEAGRAIEHALNRISRKTADAILIGSDLTLLLERPKICQAVRKARLPAIFPWRDYHDYGALISYGFSGKEIGRRAAVYVNRILNGANPAELPVEEMSKFELVIDMREARALGIDIPQEFVMRADELIQ